MPSYVAKLALLVFWLPVYCPTDQLHQDRIEAMGLTVGEVGVHLGGRHVDRQRVRRVTDDHVGMTVLVHDVAMVATDAGGEGKLWARSCVGVVTRGGGRVVVGGGGIFLAATDVEVVEDVFGVVRLRQSSSLSCMMPEPSGVIFPARPVHIPRR